MRTAGGSTARRGSPTGSDQGCAPLHIHKGAREVRQPRFERVEFLRMVRHAGQPAGR